MSKDPKTRDKVDLRDTIDSLIELGGSLVFRPNHDRPYKVITEDLVTSGNDFGHVLRNYVCERAKMRAGIL